MNILSIVSMNKENFNQSFNTLDRLLWRRHYTPILIIYNEKENKDMEQVFQKCWQQGHTSVLLLWHNTSFTYNPYPNVKVIPLKSFHDFHRHTVELRNFQKFEFKIPVIDFPPRCFSYRNKQGVEILSGYFWKMIETFVLHHNGTLQQTFVDIWNTNLDRELATDLVANQGYQLMTTVLMPTVNYETSNAIFFGKVFILIPSGKEIPQYVYLLITFNMEMWIMVFSIFIILILLILAVKRRYSRRIDISGALLRALKVIIFTYDNFFEDKTILNYVLSLLFLCIGLFLTNSYSCNLSSIYISRIYEPDLNTLQDIADTRLRIHIYSLDYDQYMALENLPDFLYKRMFVGDNNLYQENRKNLIFNDLSTGSDDIIDYYIFQQHYMSRPIAKYIPEPMYTIPRCVTLPNRSPFLEPFNRYFSYIQDSGLLEKFMADSKWDGIISSNLRFFPDEEPNRSMSLTYLQYAFIMWIVGLFSALLVFIAEIYYYRKSSKSISK
ncbi:uncharacterized protein [Musca autumnalis]|uniref:uncharacterized protein n=1 Tax=Musca autumnalis TaxID=221902 RepID=UPI003CF4CB62